ncbi:MAG: MarR family winged helix-turn-helix transcriptional regulator [Rhizobiaceae bacterium]
MSDSQFDLDSFLPYRLHQASEAVSEAFRSVYRDQYGMSRTEWRVLAHLGQHGPMTATQIGAAAAARLHKTKISRAVRELENRRWLKRTVADKDRRVQLLELTSSGRAAYTKLGELAHNYNLELARKLGARHFKQSMDMIEKLSQLAGQKQ